MPCRGKLSHGLRVLLVALFFGTRLGSHGWSSTVSTTTKSVRNPITGRSIRVGGPTYERLIETGAWVYHRQALHPVYGDVYDGTTNEDDKDDLVYETVPPTLYDRSTPTTTTINKENDMAQAVADDCGLWFVHKPAGLLSVPGRTQPDCLATRLHHDVVQGTIGTDGVGVGSSDIGYPDSCINNTTASQIAIHSQQQQQRHHPRSSKGKKYNQQVPPSSTIQLCHRLDRDTSGIVAVAVRNTTTHRMISQQFADRTIAAKVYTCLVAGHVHNDSGVVDAPIGKEYVVAVPASVSTSVRDGKRNANSQNDSTATKPPGGYNRWVVNGGTKPREARTRYRVDRRCTVRVSADTHHSSSSMERHYTRLWVEPLTGRGQQIRLHMKHLGHPLLGDTLHGHDDNDDTNDNNPSQEQHTQQQQQRQRGAATATPRLCLHATTLALTIDGITLQAHVPSPF